MVQVKIRKNLVKDTNGKPTKFPLNLKLTDLLEILLVFDSTLTLDDVEINRTGISRVYYKVHKLFSSN